jgi:hypothetical protein
MSLCLQSCLNRADIFSVWYQYHPLSQSGSYLTSDGRGMGYMIVDSLDSLLVMGFEDEYVRAREWVREELSFNIKGQVNAFEVSLLRLVVPG